MKGDNAKTLVKISELARMSGVPSPTIKHYMREGLLPGPAHRTSRNMAYYDVRLAARVKAIKELQQTHFLPLKVIADLLEPSPSATLRGEKLGALAPSIKEGHEIARKRRATEDSTRRRTVAEVLAQLQITKKELDQLDKLGLAKAVKPARGEPYYTDADLDIVEIIDETRRNGMGDLFPMSTLEPYVACIRTLVRVEIEMFRRAVFEQGASLPDLPLPQIAREATQLGERLVVAMRTKLVFPELAALASGAPPTAAKPARRRKKS